MTAVEVRFDAKQPACLNHLTDWDFILRDYFPYCLSQGALWDIQGPARESTVVISRQDKLSGPVMGPRRPVVPTYSLTDFIAPY
jgi:hypothetical protein